MNNRADVFKRRIPQTSKILAILLPLLLLDGCGRANLHCGNTVSIENRDTFLVAMVDRGRGMFAGRVEGVEVAFYADQEEIGHARTDKLGYAVAIGRIPVGKTTIEAMAFVDGHYLEADGEIHSWEADRTIVVCDIDGTISQTDISALVFDQWDVESTPMPDASHVLQTLSKHYNILFLTGRPIFWRDKTLEWLKVHGFPEAPVIFAPDIREAEKIEQFKQRIITKVQNLYPNALVGIGNALTDSEAYMARGMLAIMVDDGKDRRFRSRALALRTWEEIGKFFEANNDLLSRPDRVRKLIHDGGIVSAPLPPLITEEIIPPAQRAEN